MNINSVTNTYATQTSYQNKKVSEGDSEGGFAKELSAHESNKAPDASSQVYQQLTEQEARAILSKPSADRTMAEKSAYARLSMSNPALYNKLGYEQAVQHSSDKDVKGIVKAGENSFTFYKDGGVEVPNKYASLVVPGDPDKTLENIYNIFGRGNVTTKFFSPGQEPTNAELYEMRTGKSLIQELKKAYNQI